MLDFSQHRILLVDVEPDNLEVFKATLEMLHDATVKTATSASAALSLLTSFHPTMIVTDLSMPKIDGYAFLHLLHERADTSTLPIIALTAHAMKGDKDQVLAAGFDGYISKPFDVNTLANQLESALEAFAAKPAQKIHPVSISYSDLTHTSGTNGESHEA